MTTATQSMPGRYVCYLVSKTCPRRELTSTIVDTTSEERFTSTVAIAAWDGTEDGQNHFDQVVKQWAPDGNLQLFQNRGEIAFNHTLLEAYVGTKVAGLRNADGQWIIYQSNEEHTQVMFQRVDLEDANAEGGRGQVMGLAL
jgi:hypothetical protein